MQTNNTTEEKTAVDYLNFGAKTAKRVDWEAFEFTVTAPERVKVTNASYGYLKDDHAYTVGVDEQDGVIIPKSCECPADQYSEDYDCKHKVALAVVGGPAVLSTAMMCGAASSPSEQSDETPTESLRADGGCECDQFGFPCWECVRIGRREIP